MRILFVLFLLILPLVSCAPSVNSVMNSWTGQHMSDLVASWGPPSQVFKNIDEGGVLVYFEGQSNALLNYEAKGEPAGAYKFQAYKLAASAPAYDSSKAGGGENSRLFWVNADGYISFWALKGF